MYQHMSIHISISCCVLTTVRQEKKRGVLQMLKQSSKQGKTVAGNEVSAKEMMRIWLWGYSASWKPKHLEDSDMRCLARMGNMGSSMLARGSCVGSGLEKLASSLSLSPPFFPSFPHLLSFLLPFWYSSLYLPFHLLLLFSPRHPCKCQTLFPEIIQTESNPTTCRT